MTTSPDKLSLALNKALGTNNQYNVSLVYTPLGVEVLLQITDPQGKIKTVNILT